MKEKKKHILKRLLPYSGNKKPILYLAMLFSAISGVFMLLPMIYIHRIIREMILAGEMNFELIKKNAIYAAAFSLLGLLLYTGALVASHVFAFEVEQNIIKISINEVMKKPIGYLENRESGKLRNIIIGGAGETHSILAHQLPDIARTFISQAVILIFLFVFDFRLGLASIIPVFISMIIMATMMTNKGKKDREEYYTNLNNLSAEAVEYVRGIPVVKAFGQSIESFKRLNALILNVKNSVLRMALGWRNKMSLYEVITGAAAFFIVPMAIFLISRGENPQRIVADSVIYLLIGPTFGVLIMRSAAIGQYMYFAEQALDKIEDALAYPEMKYGENKIEDGGIEFKNVSFSYGNEKVLDNISFKVKEGERVALVGSSGGGKSTIAKLVARFYDAEEGEVLVGGKNIKDYEKAALMKDISFVFQNPGLFKKTLRDNILIGKPAASDKEIEEALLKSGAKEVTDRLVLGLDTVFGSKGTYFSGGEIQRFAIARAFLKDAKYVILDEATAFADPENEHIIQKSFKELSKNKTTLMIAHRLSTVIDADRVLVIDKGKIVQEGKHEELLAEGGIYKKLWEEYQRSVAWKIGEKND